jgi:serine/threonine protein kinase
VSARPLPRAPGTRRGPAALNAPLCCSIYDKIGRGKHSVVYKGRKKKTIQYYAIKSVEKSQKSRVLQEVGPLIAAMAASRRARARGGAGSRAPSRRQGAGGCSARKHAAPPWAAPPLPSRRSARCTRWTTATSCASTPGERGAAAPAPSRAAPAPAASAAGRRPPNAAAPRLPAAPRRRRYETTNHLWLILEYCVGGDLMSLLREDARLPESSIHDFARDLVIALQYLHHHSIIYCDLKPSNVLLDENGRLKLGGFGLSRRLSDINKASVAALPPVRRAPPPPRACCCWRLAEAARGGGGTCAGEPPGPACGGGRAPPSPSPPPPACPPPAPPQAKRGTPCYMAPELFQDGATHSTASDLWSLGCVLYECATGQPPFLGETFADVVNDLLNREPAPVPGARRGGCEPRAAGRGLPPDCRAEGAGRAGSSGRLRPRAAGCRLRADCRAAGAGRAVCAALGHAAVHGWAGGSAAAHVLAVPQARRPSSRTCCSGCWTRTPPPGPAGRCAPACQPRPACLPFRARRPARLPPCRQALGRPNPLPPLQELVAHSFWQLAIPPLAMPEEPMLAAFISKYNLAPSGEDALAARVGGGAAGGGGGGAGG